MTTTRSTFDAAIASRNMKLTRTTSNTRASTIFEPEQFLLTVPWNIFIMSFCGAAGFLGGGAALLIIYVTWYYEFYLRLDLVIPAVICLAAGVSGSIAAHAMHSAHRVYIDYAIDDTVTEETAEPLPRSEAAEQDGGFVQTASNRLTRVNYKFTRAQAVWLHQIARDGEPFPIRDGAFKDSKVWTNYTATYPDVKEKLMDAGALDEQGKWTAAGVVWARWLRSEV